MEDLPSCIVVLVVPGNVPPIDTEQAVEIAVKVQTSETHVFWRSAYGGIDRVSAGVLPEERGAADLALSSYISSVWHEVMSAGREMAWEVEMMDISADQEQRTRSHCSC